MKRKNWRAAVGAFVITLIVLGTVAGCLLADHHTAYMTFGADTPSSVFSAENMVLIDMTEDGPMFRPLSTFIPMRFRVLRWLEQLERDTVAYWMERIL